MIRFFAKLFRSDPWVGLLLALLSFAIALGAAAAPRMLGTATDEQLRASITGLPPTQRNPVANWTQDGTDAGPRWKSTDEGWGSWANTAQQFRATLEAPLADLVGQPGFVAVGAFGTDYVPPKESALYQVTVRPAVNPTLQQDMRLVDGAWPKPTTSPVTDIVLSRVAADRVRAKVGDELVGDPKTYKVAGIVEPTHPDDDRWSSHDLGNTFAVNVDPNNGEAAIVWGYVAPETVDEEVAAISSVNYKVFTWLPIDGRRLSDQSDAGTLSAQLTKLLSEDPRFATIQGNVRYQSELGRVLDGAAKQQAAAATLVAVVGAGPLGLSAALMALGAALVVGRREDALKLLIARGASPEQLRRAAAIEGVLFAVPAAVAGHLVATLVPGHSPWWQWLLTLAIGSFPALTLMRAAGAVGTRQRRDLSSRGSRLRLAAELGVLLVAAAAVWQLLTSPADSTRLDVLAVATPLLLALATALLAMRVLPLPLAALVRAFRRARGLVGQLGSARALRDPAGGLIPTLALVLGITVAVLGTVLLGTVTRGATTAAWTATGADVKINGTLTTTALDEIRKVPGVTAADGLGPTGSEVSVTVAGKAYRVEIWVAGPEVAKVWADTPLQTSLPEGTLGDGTVLLGGDLPEFTGDVSVANIGTLRSVGHADEIPGVPTLPQWALMSRATWEAAGKPAPGMSRTFIAVDEGADPAKVADEATRLVPFGEAFTVAKALERATGDKVTRALTIALVSAAVASIVLTALALIVVQVMGSRSRAELLAVLRTQGLARGQSMGIVAWEVGPLAALSLIVGTLAGIGIAGLLVAAVDLTGLTGGLTQPALAVEPLSLLVVTATVVLVLGIAVTATAWAAGRTNLAQQLRIGERQ